MEEAARILGARHREAAVTLGPGGAVWSDGLALVRRPARPVSVVDSTGAGDAFTAGFLAARLAGADPAAALEAGNALAVRALDRPGAR